MPAAAELVDVPLEGMPEVPEQRTSDEASEGDVAPRRSRRSGTRRPRTADKPDKAPRSRASGSRSAAPTRSRAALAPRIESLYTTLGLGLSMVPQPWAAPTGMAVVENASSCAKAWEALAKENPAVREALERLLTVSSMGTLLAAHAPIVIAALAASGKLPAGLGGVGSLVPVEVDEAQAA